MSYADIAQGNKVNFEGFNVNDEPMKEEIKLAGALKKLSEKNEEKDINRWYDSYLLDPEDSKDETVVESMKSLGHFHIREMYNMFCESNNCDFDIDKFVILLYKCTKIIRPDKLHEKLFRK